MQAVQFTDYGGTEVIATASTASKLKTVRSLGADHAVNYEERDFAAAVRELTGQRGVDVVVDHIGAATWGDSLAKGGRLVTCGATTGANPTIDVPRIFWIQLSVLGSTMSSSWSGTAPSNPTSVRCCR